MGLPEIKISFKSKALNLIKRSERGVVLLVTEDSKQSVKSYNSIFDVENEEYSENVLDMIKLAFFGGTNKLIVKTIEESEEVNDTLKAIEDISFDYLVFPHSDGSKNTSIVNWIKEKRRKGKTVKAVVYNATTPDTEGVINFVSNNVICNDLITGNKTFSGNDYICRIAGILAGLPLNRSATYFELPEVLSVDLMENEDALVDAGKLFITKQYDKYRLSRAVNSLTSTSSEKSKQFQKIKIVEAMDMITKDIKETFTNDYVGKVINNSVNKRILLDVINGIYFDELEGNVLDPDYENKLDIDYKANKLYAKEQGEDVDNMSDTEILHYPTGSNVFLTGKIKLVDAMEDLTINFSI